MQRNKFQISVALAFLLTGCAGIQQQSFTLSNGQVVDYIHGKVDADGQTGVFRDVFINGEPVYNSFGAGPSLTASLLDGAVQGALIAGGMAGAAALLRPAESNYRLSNDQAQGQGQSQEQKVLLPPAAKHEEPIHWKPKHK